MTFSDPIQGRRGNVCPILVFSHKALPTREQAKLSEAKMVWRLMWQVTMWFTPPRALNRYQAVAAALAAH